MMEGGQDNADFSVMHVVPTVDTSDSSILQQQRFMMDGGFPMNSAYSQSYAVGNNVMNDPSSNNIMGGGSYINGNIGVNSNMDFMQHQQMLQHHQQQLLHPQHLHQVNPMMSEGGSNDYNYSNNNQQLSGMSMPYNAMSSNTAINPVPSSSSSRGNAWFVHVPDIVTVRESIRSSIIELLSARRSNPTPEWHEKLPQMGQKIEEALFHHSKSMDEYSDKSTLKVRLQNLASIMNQKKGNSAIAASLPPQQQQQQSSQEIQQHLKQQQQQQYYQQLQQQPCYTQQPQSQQASMFTGNNEQYSTVVDVNNSSIRQQQYQQKPQSQQFVTDVNNSNNYVGSSSNQVSLTKPPQSSSSSNTNSNSNNISNNNNNNSSNNEDHRKQVLKQQQQRLLLLRHASKCPHEHCTVTVHCENMKKLWKHIMSCKKQDCTIPHCVSSRYVLSHYSKCRDTNCHVCGPVREAIRRNYEKSQHVVTMAKNTYKGLENTSASATSKRSDQREEKVNNGTSKRGKYAKEGIYNHQVVPLVKVKPTKINPIDPISCPMYMFSQADIESHYKNIHIGMPRFTNPEKGSRSSSCKNRVQSICSGPLDEIGKKDSRSIFAQPVNPIALNLPDYFTIVRNPMDLGTVRKKLNKYRDVQDCIDDVNLTFDNAMMYNAKGTDVHALAKELKKFFNDKVKKAIKEDDEFLSAQRLKYDNCFFCGLSMDDKIVKLQCIYYCSGFKCGGARIQKNPYYEYKSSKSKMMQYFWCQQCYNALKDSEPILKEYEGVEIKISKHDLVKHEKMIEPSEEMVGCDDCDNWAHYTCALFNKRGDDVKNSYLCPPCFQTRTAKGEKLLNPLNGRKTLASELPQNTLSTFIERRLAERLHRAYREKSDRLGVPFEDIEKIPDLTLRVVASYDKDQQVREFMHQRYKGMGYPSHFPCRVKCLVLFQKIDGQDAILFAMYVFEYGHKCPQPNQRRVYISYLDSVHYFRPRQYRTMVYHEILVSYLEYMKRRGFHTVHIWSCPPTGNDDYIMSIHPEDQMVPKQVQLNKWYVDMLNICKARDIVLEVNDMYSEYFVDTSINAYDIPYFEGDYWQESEKVIQEIVDSEIPADHGDTDDVGAKSKRKQVRSKNKARSTVGGNTGGSIVWDPTQHPNERDPLMTKFAAIMNQAHMKPSFFVGRMHPKEYVLQHARVDEIVSDNLKSAQQLQEEALSDNCDVAVNVNMSNAKKPEDEVKSGVKAEDNYEQQQRQEDSGNKDMLDEQDDYDFGSAAANVTTGISDDNLEGYGDTGKMMQQSVFDDHHLSIDNTSAVGNKSRSDNAVEANAQDSEMNGQIDEEIDNNSNSKGASISRSVNQKSLPSIASTNVQQVKQRGRPRGRPSITAVSGGDAVASSGTASSAVSSASINNNSSTTDDNTKKAIPLSSSNTDLYSGSKQQKSKVISNTVSSSATAVDATSAAVAVKVFDETFELEMKTKYSIDDLVVNIKDDTEDVDDTINCVHWETRHDFLQLCQINQYQFDHLRRLKYTSMMVLYHLHNPDAPKYLPQCNMCFSEIMNNQGVVCPKCEINFCYECFRVAGGQSIHNHELRQMIDPQELSKQMTEEQRRDRQKSIQIHLQLLYHSANVCVNNKECNSRNCLKMKEFLKHEIECKAKVANGCPQCKRMYNLLSLHAKQCRVENCLVPNCVAIRERLRQNQLRQQAMDDNRRSHMNSLRGGGSQSNDQE